VSGRREPATPPKLTDFEFRSLLGSGGYADVYLYEQLRPRREVAVKVLLAEGLTDEGRRQFAAEADLMAALSAHPAIVTIYDADIASDGRPYLVMEYYPGPNLSARVRAERMPVADVLRIAIQIAAAVETAHRAGILHRDIKPANILTSRYQKPGLTDFGISASTQGEQSDDQGALSVPWAPPEAFGADDDMDARADIYSLGATIYTLLAGRTPFERGGASNTHLDLMTRIERDPVPPIGRQDVPPELERLLAQSMAKSPDSRPQTALSMARALQQIEIDLRFQPSAIDVLDDLAGVSRHAPVPDEGDATRIRGVVTVDPQQAPRGRSLVDSVPPAGISTQSFQPMTAPVKPAGVPAAPAISPARTPPGAADDDDAGHTVRRQTAPAEAAGSADVGPVAAQKGRKGMMIGLGAAAAVVVIAGGAFALTSKGGSEPATEAPAPVEGAAAPSSILQDRPTAPTGIALVRNADGSVAISWSNPDPQTGDGFAWWRTDPGADPRPQTTSELAATIPAVAKGEFPCVIVVTVREGLSSIEPNQPTCLAAKG
jgi:serine/threonine protein kinase